MVRDARLSGIVVTSGFFGGGRVGEASAVREMPFNRLLLVVVNGAGEASTLGVATGVRCAPVVAVRFFFLRYMRQQAMGDSIPLE